MSQQTQQLMQALRRASEAADQGDQQAAQDARRLAQMLQQAQQAGDARSPQQQRGMFDEFARGVGTGLTDLVGLVPGAAMELGNLTGLTDFEDVRGGEMIRRNLPFLGDLGLTHRPGEDATATLPGAMGEMVGGSGFPGAAIVGGLGRRAVGEVVEEAPGLIRRGRDLVNRPGPEAEIPSGSTVGRILDDIGTQAARNPRAAGTAEMAGAAGAGAGRYVGEQEWGEGGWESSVSELIGGIAGGIAPTTTVPAAGRAINSTLEMFPVTRMVKDSVGRFFGVEGDSSARRAVQQRLQEVTDLRGRLDSSDPEVAEAASRRLQEIQRGLRGQDPEVLSEYLTPAQMAGDEGILSLAARARADNPQLLAHWRAQVEENMNALRTRLQNLGEDADPNEFTRMAQQEVDDLVTVAAGNARRKIATFGEGRLSNTEASQIMRQELEDAYRAARSQERGLWAEVPGDMVMPAENVRARYLELRNQLGDITSADMPEVARRYLDPSSGQSWLPPAQEGVQDTVPLTRLQELRSALLDEAANASSGIAPNRNRARLARQLADGILDDLQAVDPRESPGTAAFVAARDFSRHLNDRFTRGPVGEVLRVRPNRGGVIPDEETLQRTVGRGKTRAVSSTRAFARALRSPSEGAQGAYRDFLDGEFMSMAFREGRDGQRVVSEEGAQRFMRKYGELFERNPDTANRYLEMMRTGRLDEAATRVSDGVSSVLSKGNPAQEVRRIRDITRGREGQAVWEGFRRNMLNELIGGASRTRDGETTFSGQAILSRLDNDPKFRRALEETFSRTELQRLRQLANTAARIERDMAAPAAARLADSEPPLLNQIIARIGGARAGAAVDQAMGGGSAGTSLQSAQLGSSIFSRLARRGIRDPQQKLVLDALNNQDLLDSLLIPPRSPQARDRFASVLNAWAVYQMDEQDAEQLGLTFDASLDEYITDAVHGLEGKPTEAERRRARQMERQDRINPTATLPRAPERPAGPAPGNVRGPQGEVGVMDALRSLPSPSDYGVGAGAGTVRGPNGRETIGQALRGLPSPGQAGVPPFNTNPPIRGGSQPGGLVSEILRRRLTGQ